MLLFCPTCANLLVAQEDECYQFVCSTCPYVHKVTRLVSHFLLTGLRETNFGAETETPKASRLKCRRRWERGAEGGVMWGSCVPSLLGVGLGVGCAFSQKIFEFFIWNRVFWCILSGIFVKRCLQDIETITPCFAGQADILRRKWANLCGNKLKTQHTCFRRLFSAASVGDWHWNHLMLH